MFNNLYMLITTLSDDIRVWNPQFSLTVFNLQGVSKRIVQSHKIIKILLLDPCDWTKLFERENSPVSYGFP